jgi:hypothetical protein
LWVCGLEEPSERRAVQTRGHWRREGGSVGAERVTWAEPTCRVCVATSRLAEVRIQSCPPRCVRVLRGCRHCYQLSHGVHPLYVRSCIFKLEVWGSSCSLSAPSDHNGCLVNVGGMDTKCRVPPPPVPLSSPESASPFLF